MPAVGDWKVSSDMSWLEERFLHRLRRSRLLRVLRVALDDQPFVCGGASPSRVMVHPTVWLNDAVLNIASGTITIEEWAFLGSGVSLLAGTHDITERDAARQRTIPSEGRDIRVCRGAWIASNAIVIGPCTIGEHAVVGAGSVVTSDVEPYTFVTGVPAKFKSRIP